MGKRDEAGFEVVVRGASIIAATLLLSACGEDSDPLRYFCAQIASKDQLEACINDTSMRHQLVEKQAAERANRRVEYASDYNLRDLERSLATDVIKDAQRVKIVDLPKPLEIDNNEQPSPGFVYVVRGEISVDSGGEEGERSYIWIYPIDQDATSDDVGWLAENQLLSPRQLQTLEAICAFFGDSEHPLCVGDIYVEIVLDPVLGPSRQCGVRSCASPHTKTTTVRNFRA
jgi:hypothetical protein